MITIEEAIQLIKENLPEKKVELRATYTCNGFVLAEDVYAQYSSPYFDNSAMDGYALSTEDTEFLIDTYEPKEFDVIGTSQAGIPFMGRIPKGKCIQVNTGAKIPENTGAIVPVEDVEFINHNKIKIKQPIKKFQHIRRKGEEFKENTLLLTKNTKLNPRNIAMLLQAGKFEIFVYKKPKILIVTTGNELTPFNENIEEEDIEKGKIIDTNSYILKTILEEKGYEIKLINHVKDIENETYEAIQNNINFDFFLLTGGVSVGPYDFVKKDVEKAGFKPIFWKIKQKPGKPIYFAKKENKVLFALPGNPVSSFINFQHYVLPAIQYYQEGIWKYNTILLKSNSEIFNEQKRDAFLTIRIIDNEYFEIAPNQGSHKISSIAYSEGYIVLPSSTRISRDQTYTCYLWM